MKTEGGTLRDEALKRLVKELGRRVIETYARGIQGARPAGYEICRKTEPSSYRHPMNAYGQGRGPRGNWTEYDMADPGYLGFTAVRPARPAAPIQTGSR